MLKKYLKLLIITSIVILLPIVAGVVFWKQMPDQVPYHWNGAGEVDGWASKPFAVLGTPFIFLALQWLSVFFTVNDPKRKNHSDKILQLIFWLVPALSIVIACIVYAGALGREIRVEMLLPIFMGVLFVAIGNYLPKCKQNYTVGIKISWTLASEENWNKTHRLSGYIWVAGGLVMVLAGFLGLIWLLMPVALLMALIPIVYSFILHRKGV